MAKTIDHLKVEVGRLEERDKRHLAYTASLRAQRHDLLMAVGKKYPGETRHETAKRYIVEAETSSN